VLMPHLTKSDGEERHGRRRFLSQQRLPASIHGRGMRKCRTFRSSFMQTAAACGRIGQVCGEI